MSSDADTVEHISRFKEALVRPVLRRRQGQAAGEGMAATDASLFGRKTFEKMAAFWPHQPDTDRWPRI